MKKFLKELKWTSFYSHIVFISKEGTKRKNQFKWWQLYNEVFKRNRDQCNAYLLSKIGNIPCDLKILVQNFREDNAAIKTNIFCIRNQHCSPFIHNNTGSGMILFQYFWKFKTYSSENFKKQIIKPKIPT